MITCQISYFLGSFELKRSIFPEPIRVKDSFPIDLSIFGDISQQKETLVSQHFVIADYQAFGIFEQCYPRGEVNVG